jgi:hypothetical protein
VQFSHGALANSIFLCVTELASMCALNDHFLFLPVVFIKGLLENVGTDIEPLRLIKRIPNKMEIPDLKQALLKILQDYHLQVSWDTNIFQLNKPEMKQLNENFTVIDVFEARM